MTKLISVDTGLVVRYGSATYQFNRYLDLRQKIQLENQLTGERKVLELSRFHGMLESGALVPVLGDANSLDQGGGEHAGHQILDLSSLPDKVKEQIDFRCKVVRYIRKLGIRRGQRSRIAQAVDHLFKKLEENSETNLAAKPSKKPSTSTVMSWMRNYETAGMNAAALISGNHCRKRTRTISEAVDDAMVWALKKYYLNTARLSLTFTYERLQERLKELVSRRRLSAETAKVSLATFQRRKDELDPYMVTASRYGTAYAKHNFRATINGTNVDRPLARLEVDHTLLNWVVVCDRTGLPLGRPTLTVVIDSYSGYLVGLYVSFNGPGLTSVLNVIKNSIRPKNDLAQAAGTTKPWIAWGLGDCFILDNGMEFHCEMFKVAAWELACDIEYCRVRTPWLKPKVERFFANLDYLTLVHGRVYKPEPNLLNVDPKESAVITLSQLCKGLVLFACDVHAFTPNSRTLELPFDRFSEGIEKCPPPQVPQTMAGLDLIAAMSKTMTVSNGGVEFYGLSYAGYELRELLGSAGRKFRTLVKWNPDDLGYLYAQHSRSKEWVTLTCTRPDYAYGLSWNQHRLIRDFMRKKLQLSGAVDHLIEAKCRLHDLWMEPLAKKNKSLEYETAKKFSQLSAGSSTFVSAPEMHAPQPTKALAKEEMDYAPQDIPDFDSISM